MCVLKLPKCSLFWTNGSQCLTLSLRLVRHQLRCHRWAGRVGVLCASPSSAGHQASTLQRQGSASRSQGARASLHLLRGVFSFFIKVLRHSSEFAVMKGLQPACSDAAPLVSLWGFYTEQQWYVRADVRAGWLYTDLKLYAWLQNIHQKKRIIGLFFLVNKKSSAQTQQH